MRFSLKGPWALSPEKARGALPFVTALAIALILWVVARQDREFVVRQTVPVRTQALPGSLVYLEDASRESVTVAFAARGADVLLDQALGCPRSLALQLAPVDLSGPYPRRVDYNPSQEQLLFRGRQYSKLTAREFDPAVISVTLDWRQSSPRPVEVRVSGRIPGRYLWTGAAPSNVTVTGPRSLLGEIASVPTEPVPPDGSVESVSLAELDRRITTNRRVADVQVVSPICPLRAVSVR